MIALEMRNLGGGEILHACPQESLDKPLPCIVFYHGFTSSKLVYSYFAVALAEVGFRVIMPDAPEHGARYQAMRPGGCSASGRFCSRISGSFLRCARR